MRYTPVLLAAVAAVFLGLTAVALAQEEVPPPYAGMTNPFDWQDEEARQAGEELYGRLCLGCHGATGGQISAADFSVPDFPQQLEERADYYFWITTEGRLSAGMPPFKANTDQTERWQLLTYIDSLATAEPPPDDTGEPSAAPAGAIKLNAPEEARAGEPITLTAFLMDPDFEPLPEATVTFHAMVDFFIEEWAEIGRAATDDEGNAVLEVTLKVSGDPLRIAARYPGAESIQEVTVAPATEPLYEVHVGLELPEATGDLVFGPEEAFSLREGAKAPTTYFRWPGNMPGLLFFMYAAAMALVWSLYIRIWYQFLKVPMQQRVGQPDTRTVPFVGLMVMIGFLALLIGILVTGPQSHFHLLH